MTEDRQALPGLTPQAQQFVLDHRGVVGACAGALLQRGVNATRADLVALGNKGLVELAARLDLSADVPRSRLAWVCVEGAMRDGLRAERRHRRLIQEGERAAGAFVNDATGDVDPNQETSEQIEAALVEEAYGLAAARLMGTASAYHRMTPEELVIGRQDFGRAMELLDACIAELAVRDREILQLHYHEQLDLTEVAPRLGIPYSTLTRYHREALLRLGKELRKKGLSR
jgi:RNA polymerase sigma factor (sigma-70 family)